MNNMRKLLCLIIIIIVLLSSTGCSTYISMDPEESDSSFVQVESGTLIGGHTYKIVYHRYTKVMYVCGHYCDFEIMINPDGTPMIWDGE